ncbi:uncharacterized protein LOC127463191 [Manacus candei]|uniref:uncharacterized protein LOC127463191 n=1 Tax=Manacus candei TaxID=415023 RepID=UPI0022263973|nr:uncharacterized protein LOC127463191 [Manacus candei]
MKNKLYSTLEIDKTLSKLKTRAAASPRSASPRAALAEAVPGQSAVLAALELYLARRVAGTAAGQSSSSSAPGPLRETPRKLLVPPGRTRRLPNGNFRLRRNVIMGPSLPASPAAAGLHPHCRHPRRQRGCTRLPKAAAVRACLQRGMGTQPLPWAPCSRVGNSFSEEISPHVRPKPHWSNLKLCPLFTSEKRPTTPTTPSL